MTTFLLLFLLVAHAALWFAWFGPKFYRHTSQVTQLAPPPAGDDGLPPVCAIIPARNEEAFVGAAVRSLCEQDYPRLKVIVANDHSTDRTAEILDDLAAEFSPARLAVIEPPEPPAGWMGKCNAVWTAVQQAPADTELYLFCDADVIHRRDTLRRAVRTLEEEGADLLGLLPRLDCIGFWENATMPALVHLGVVHLDPTRFNDPQHDEAVALGAFGLARRSVYEKWGGHQAIRGEVIDDLAMGVRTKRAGGRLALARDPRAIHLRMYSSLGEIIRGFEKNMHTAAGGGLLRPLGIAAGLALIHLVPAATAVIAPLAGLGFGLLFWTAVLLWLATGLALVERVGMQARLRPLMVALGYPVGALVLVYIGIKSAYDGHIEGVVNWRGRRLNRPEQETRIF